MTLHHVVDAEGRYDGRTLTEALPLVVTDILSKFDPVEIILFGSVARGDDGPDSDLDLLVVFDKAEQNERRDMMRSVRRAIHTFVPVDVVIADVPELLRDRDNVGSAVYWPLKEGRSGLPRVWLTGWV
jgi:uncharacterized protein